MFFEIAMKLSGGVGAIEHGRKPDLPLIRSQWGLFSGCRTHLSRLSTRMHRQKFWHPAQIHHGCREREDLLNFRSTAQLHLAQDAVLLAVAKHRLDELTRVLAEPVASVARRAMIDAARAARGVLRDVLGDVDTPAALDEGLDVLGLVRADGLARFARHLGAHLERRLSTGGATGLGQPRSDNQ